MEAIRIGKASEVEVHYNLCATNIDSLLPDKFPTSIGIKPEYRTGTGKVELAELLLEIPTHPRSMGTFPRKIRKYVLEDQVISLHQAVRSMTSLPDERFRLKGRILRRDE